MNRAPIFQSHTYQGAAPEAATAPTVSLPASAAPDRRFWPRRFASALARHWIWLGPAMIVVVGLFDLVCTLTAYHEGWLVEGNPLARAVLDRWGAPGLAAYRLALMYIGCVLLVWGLRMYRLRRHLDSAHRRIRAVVWGGQIVLILSHAALVAWWSYWLLASA
ncbi:MAG: hypothetical protein D6760_06025 [Deltaproteobacteria bacterium]|nr:MAG: hypothetical protein D6760_06025 [Deltaproteobacteria bacterium]